MNSSNPQPVIENQIPAQYSTLISERQYFRILAYICRYFDQPGCSLKEITDGIVSLEREGETETIKIVLDNLVKRLTSQAEENWKQHIDTHFERLLEATDTSSLFSNFQLAKEYLTLRLYGDQIDTHSENDELIFRQDLAGTFSVLSLDLPTKFQVVLKSEIAAWEMEEQTLFNIAQENANRQEVETAHGYWEEVEIMAVLSNEYAAIKLLDVEKNFKDSIGEHGALVAVPTKGTVFIHPIRYLSDGLKEALNLIIKQTNKIYDSDPGPITRNLYWYFEEQFYEFALISSEEGIAYKIPEHLQRYLENRNPS